jgi:superoxide dismutase
VERFFDDKVKVYVINLPQHQNRMSFMKKQFDEQKIKFSRVKARIFFINRIINNTKLFINMIRNYCDSIFILYPDISILYESDQRFNIKIELLYLYI